MSTTGNAIATTNEQDWSVIEKVVVDGDLSKLSSQDLVTYYRMYCESLNLNPATRPFQYMTLKGKKVLYATKDATEQLRKLHNVSIVSIDKERIDDLYVVTATAQLPNGRRDSDMGAVSVTSLKGEDLANAMLKAITKAKRRVTLSICGLGILDESELHSIPNVQTSEHPRETPQVTPQRTPEPTVDTDTGEIVTPLQAAAQRLPDKLILRLEELATAANVGFEQMEQDAVERYQKRDYTWLSVDDAKDYAIWLKVLAEERIEAEQSELIEA